jgi:predicted HTH domain antitoxin
VSRAVRLNATMDEDLLRRLDAYARDHYEDRSTALRQLVDFALRELRKRDALQAYRSGRVTLREFARALGLNVWAAHDLLRAEGVEVGQGDRAETSAALTAMLQDVHSEETGATGKQSQPPAGG